MKTHDILGRARGVTGALAVLLATGIPSVVVNSPATAATLVGSSYYPYADAIANPGATGDWGEPTCARNCSSSFVVGNATYYDDSPFGFVYRNCTDYVAYEINRQMGGSVSSVRFSWANVEVNGDGNAEAWRQGVIDNYGSGAVNSTPQIGSIAWWDAQEGGGDGHVGIVSSIHRNSNGSVLSIVVADYNSGSDGSPGDYGIHTLYPGGGGYLPWPKAFLHVADVSTGTGANGSYEVAFQANSGSLYLYSPGGGATDLALGMKADTSPAITGLPGGGYEAAFQDNTGSLWVYGTAGTHDLALGMAPGTSPAIAGLANGSYEVAFQANSGSLYLYSPGGGATDLALGMKADTAAAITT